MPDSSALALAAGAGLVAAVNPCGFALLPAYLSIFVLDEESPSRRASVWRALKATLALTLGFAAVFGVFGLAIAPVAASVQEYLPVFTIVLGLVLVVAGIWVALGRRIPTPQLRSGKTGAAAKPLTAQWWTMTGFGASYAVASIGCTIAPFLAVVVTAFRAGSNFDGVVLFAVYAGAMGLVVGAAAIAVALARRGIVNSLRRVGGPAARIAGAVLAVAGAYVAWYGFWELRVLHGGAGADPVVTAAGDIQRWLADRADQVGLVGFAVVIVVFAVLAVVPWRRVRRP